MDWKKEIYRLYREAASLNLYISLTQDLNEAYTARQKMELRLDFSIREEVVIERLLGLERAARRIREELEQGR